MDGCMGDGARRWSSAALLECSCIIGNGHGRLRAWAPLDFLIDVVVFGWWGRES
jgi:hypothetical protein